LDILSRAEHWSESEDGRDATVRSRLTETL
jgi:hypothetical protein